ncbi:MAG: hypothetical protein QOF28_1606 [Actinomycetota bacterium]|jgi:hypothetical protein|nr:hypothetical protein [Actinomycetota bacterium]
MTMTNPTGVTGPGSDPDRSARRARATTEVWRTPSHETKPSPKTTELWLTLAGIAVLVVVYHASRDASLDLFRACLLGTIGVAAYVVSRGLAKSGSHDHTDGARFDETRG